MHRTASPPKAPFLPCIADLLIPTTQIQNKTKLASLSLLFFFLQIKSKEKYAQIILNREICKIISNPQAALTIRSDLYKASGRTKQ